MNKIFLLAVSQIIVMSLSSCSDDGNIDANLDKLELWAEGAARAKFKEVGDYFYKKSKFDLKDFSVFRKNKSEILVYNGEEMRHFLWTYEGEYDLGEMEEISVTIRDGLIYVEFGNPWY